MANDTVFTSLDVTASYSGSCGKNKWTYYKGHSGFSYGGMCPGNCGKVTVKMGNDATFRPNEDGAPCPGCGKEIEIEEAILVDCSCTV
eukprot:CAMPEP_0201580662 /NCGR_PEP_ID=MMETSP0190_2-20130828/52899_1 /ASSEMBLY_ACC=CAM_ASM_000263 /TAXON_ID=37353 /ORGANISM="Rosalina sp." /LENGTH=87 /DNA_ID=CAMNT_0048017173 /DNA_START=44 /DNA_END=303 /DNA_ORIENTATION=+